MTESETSFARSSSPLGKCTAEVKSWIPEDADEALIGLAFGAGMNKSEYVREVILKHLFGEATMARMRQRPELYRDGIRSAQGR